VQRCGTFFYLTAAAIPLWRWRLHAVAAVPLARRQFQSPACPGELRREHGEQPGERTAGCHIQLAIAT